MTARPFTFARKDFRTRRMPRLPQFGQRLSVSVFISSVTLYAKGCKRCRIEETSELPFRHSRNAGIQTSFAVALEMNLDTASAGMTILFTF